MPKRPLLEICVESVAHAIAAETGGADRIELCSELSCGGLTPSASAMRAAREAVRLPIHTLIRPRAGDFCYSEAELETMQRAIDLAKGIAMNGIVLGVLDAANNVDYQRTRALVEYAHPLPVTFHRAFDHCPDQQIALEVVIKTGVRRLLTSGGVAAAVDNLLALERLVTIADGRISLMPGGGIRVHNVEGILRRVHCHEIHTSLGSAQTEPKQFESEVRRFREAVRLVFLD
jgi:copper homeostasis protein